jgi:hypothetical protein
MPAIHLPAISNLSIEAPTSQVSQVQEESPLRTLLFNIMAIGLAAATLVVACLHFCHQRKERERNSQMHGMSHPQRPDSSYIIDQELIPRRP